MIRAYEDRDEVGWVRCRALAFLDTAYYDAVERVKEHYGRPSIELVAERDAEIVGLIDVECEERPGEVCSDRPGLGGMIWHVAVHPDHRRQGLGNSLVRRARELATARGVERFEAWTRDDRWVHQWYERLGFEQIGAYLHVYVEYDEGLRELFPVADGIRPVKLFAHYVGEDRDAVRRRFRRVHDCVLYEFRF